jgi:hypothetical protein
MKNITIEVALWVLCYQLSGSVQWRHQPHKKLGAGIENARASRLFERLGYSKIAEIMI